MEYDDEADEPIVARCDRVGHFGAVAAHLRGRVQDLGTDYGGRGHDDDHHQRKQPMGAEYPTQHQHVLPGTGMHSAGAVIVAAD
jgi:hypothetical protein